WNRPLIGFDTDGNPHLRIEHRVVSAGPSAVDAVANAAFFLGLVTALAHQETPPESLLAFEQARSNFYAAARQGLESSVTWLEGKTMPMHELLSDRLLPLAYEGLTSLDIDGADRDLYLGVIGERLHSRRNGAMWQREYVRVHGTDMHALTAAYHQRQ